MGRLGDELRAAADRADVPTGIDVEKTVGAVKRRKAVRTAGPVALGVGALAIAGVAVAPMFAGFGFSAAESATDSGAVTAEDGADEAIEEGQALPENDSAAGGTMLADPYWCGADADEIVHMAVAYPWSVTASIPEQDLTGREDAPFVTVESTMAVDDSIRVLAGQPGSVILWEGIVVGLVYPGEVITWGPADEPMAADGAFEAADGATIAVDVPLVNCWDGAQLPAGNYELMTRQSFVEQAYATEEPADGGDADLPAESSGIGMWSTEESNRLPFRIAGDVVDHPFDQYLG